jgi:hypothetical protein|tara:strand:- start:266 stop:772 length:507 start_codon:yes stop_codon:yes gene_type:complete
MARQMSGSAKTFYINLTIKLTVLLGGILLAGHFNPDFRLDETIEVAGIDIFDNIDTASGLFALFFGMFAVIGYIEGRYAWDKSDTSIQTGFKVGSLGAMLGFIIMAGGIGFAFEELFLGEDFKDLNFWKSVYLAVGVLILFWLGKEEFLFSKRSVDIIYGKREVAFGG